MKPKKGDNAKAATDVVAATEVPVAKPTLESTISNLQTSMKDAVERLDVVDGRLDELENKGEELKDNVNTAINKAFEGMEKEWSAFQDALATLWEEMQVKITKLETELEVWKVAIINGAGRPKGPLLSRIKEGLSHDPMTQSLIQYANEGKSRRYWLEGDLLYTRGCCLYVPQFAKCRKDLMKECHDSKLAGHPDKIEAKKPSRLLQPLPIPERPWESVSMDFIVGLLNTDGFASIVVVVDQFSKYTTFIPASKECPAEEATSLFLKHVPAKRKAPQDQAAPQPPLKKKKVTSTSTAIPPVRPPAPEEREEPATSHADTAASVPKPPVKTATASKKTLTRKDKGKTPVRASPRAPAPEATVELDSDDDHDDDMPDVPPPQHHQWNQPFPAAALRGKPTKTSALLTWLRRKTSYLKLRMMDQAPRQKKPQIQTHHQARLATSAWRQNKHPSEAVTRIEKEEMLHHSRKDDEHKDTVALVH
ncbi:hypothetical protein GQ457_03G017850 [Hibiscus cannabinus]